MKLKKIIRTFKLNDYLFCLCDSMRLSMWKFGSFPVISWFQLIPRIFYLYWMGQADSVVKYSEKMPQKQNRAISWNVCVRLSDSVVPNDSFVSSKKWSEKCVFCLWSRNKKVRSQMRHCRSSDGLMCHNGSGVSFSFWWLDPESVFGSRNRVT